VPADTRPGEVRGGLAAAGAARAAEVEAFDELQVDAAAGVDRVVGIVERVRGRAARDRAPDRDGLGDVALDEEARLAAIGDGADDLRALGEVELVR